MLKIIKEKGRGKTETLIYLSHVTSDTIVCHSLNECTRIIEEARRLKCVIPKVITYQEFTDLKQSEKAGHGYMIDNIEVFVQWFTQDQVTVITLTP